MATGNGSLPLSTGGGKARQDRLVVTLLLILSALGLWLSLRGTDAPPPALDPAYEAHGTESLFLDATGQPLYRIRAASMRRRPGQPELELRKPSIQNLQAGTAAWTLRAATAFMDEQKRTILLSGAVELDYPLDGEPARIRTEEVLLYPDEQIAQTELPARIQWGGLSASALGFVADLREGRLELHAQVRGRLWPADNDAGGTPADPGTAHRPGAGH